MENMQENQQLNPHLLHHQQQQQQILSYSFQNTPPYHSLQHTLIEQQQQQQLYPPSALTQDQIEHDLLQMANSSQTTDSANRKRRRFDIEEKRLLIQNFYQNPKPGAELRLELSERLHMSPRGVQIWFQNQRSKAKRGITTMSTGKDEHNEDSGSSSSRDVHHSDGNGPIDTREGAPRSSSGVLPVLSDVESSNSMDINYMPMADEAREQSSADEQHRSYGMNFEPQSANMGVRRTAKRSGKQRRRRLSPEETEALRLIFEETQKPDPVYRQQLSERLDIPPQVIEIWFQNQRAKRKRRNVPSEPQSHSAEEQSVGVNTTGEYEYQEVAVNSNTPTNASWEVSMSMQPYAELQHDPSSTLNDQIAVMPYTDQITTTSEPTNSSVAALHSYEVLQHDPSSTLSDHIAMMPYADQITTTTEPGQSATGSNYSVACDTRETSYKKKASNSSQRSRALSHGEEGRMSDLHPQQRRRMGKEEIRILSGVFARTRMPTIDTREDLAKQFDRTPRSIQIWFQNQRSKLKRGLVSLESYRLAGEGLTSRDVDRNRSDGEGSDGDGNDGDGNDGDGNDGDGEQMSTNTTLRLE